MGGIDGLEVHDAGPAGRPALLATDVADYRWKGVVRQAMRWWEAWSANTEGPISARLHAGGRRQPPGSRGHYRRRVGREMPQSTDPAAVAIAIGEPKGVAQHL